jgi:UDP-glucuronate 4-epimerase
MKILVTGATMSIGFHLVCRLAKRGEEVVGIDNINDYYSVSLKYARLKECDIEPDKIVRGHKVASEKYSCYKFIHMDI